MTSDPLSVRRGEEHWRERANASGDRGIIGFAADSLADAAIGPFLRAVFANSPYLTQELTGNIGFAREIIEDGADELFARLVAETTGLPVADMPTPAVMKALRRAKRKAALLAALADIGCIWQLEAVTGALSEDRRGDARPGGHAPAGDAAVPAIAAKRRRSGHSGYGEARRA